jgi:hypothetical protein
VIAGFVNKLLGGIIVGVRVFGSLLREEKSRLFEVVVGEEEPHAAASGEDADLVEVELGFVAVASTNDRCAEAKSKKEELPVEFSAAIDVLEKL